MLSNNQTGIALMNQSYIIIDDDQESVLKTKAVAKSFQNLRFVASANTYDEGVNLILEHQPAIVFLEIDPSEKESKLSLHLINELYRYLKVVPKIIVTTIGKELAYEALQYEVVDYLLKPLQVTDFRKSILKLERAMNFEISAAPKKKLATHDDFYDDQEHEQVDSYETDEEFLETQEIDESEIDEEVLTDEDDIAFENKNAAFINEIEVEVTPIKHKGATPLLNQKDQSLVICVKSYGDYRYIDSNDVLYFEADNNSTDIHLNNGEMITAFKTLKHFEGVLPPTQFLRIHNSYIINIAQVSRIHTGNTVCYIKNSTTKLPFSKSYKENVDLIINKIAAGNYLEI